MTVQSSILNTISNSLTLFVIRGDIAVVSLFTIRNWYSWDGNSTNMNKKTIDDERVEAFNRQGATIVEWVLDDNLQAETEAVKYLLNHSF